MDKIASPNSLQERLPDAFAQLLEIKRIAETNFRDVCDLEFTVQDGRVFLIQVRTGKRTGIAAVRFAIQLMLEGKIGPIDVLTRISPRNVAEIVSPTIENPQDLRMVGSGLPSCSGIATGKIAFTSKEVFAFTECKVPTIFVKREVSPEDLGAIIASHGVLTTRGGVSSHAALACRQLGKPCVTGFSNPDVFQAFRSGEFGTINGTSGEVYFGRARFQNVSWKDVPEVIALAEIVDAATRSGSIPADSIGSTWRLHDFFRHGTPLVATSTKKRAVKARSYTSFIQPKFDIIERTRKSLLRLQASEREDINNLFFSLLSFLFRVCANALGIGCHHLYFRPLVDPERTVCDDPEYGKTQVVALEFTGINRHIPFLLDVGILTLVFEHAEPEEWFLDFTNPSGESLVGSFSKVIAYKLKVNDVTIPHADLPGFFHALRRRELNWKYFAGNRTSAPEIKNAFANWLRDRKFRSPHLVCAFELELFRGGEPTVSGLSLLDRLQRNKEHEF